MGVCSLQNTQAFITLISYYLQITVFWKVFESLCFWQR